jgi:hypothetical protein
VPGRLAFTCCDSIWAPERRLTRGWEVPVAFACARTERGHRKAPDALRRTLDETPEVEHPLGL